MKTATRHAFAILAVAMLSLLAGCAAFAPACLVGTCHRAFDGVVVAADGKPVTEEGRAIRAQQDEVRKRAAEDKRLEAERRAEEWRALQARQVAEAAAQKEAERAHIVADEARGYKHVSFTDFILDYKTMPVGSKRAVKGIYQSLGNLEILVASLINDTPRVVLLTDSAPREVRAKLLDFTCRQIFCEVLLLGHTTRCTVTWAGRPVRSDVCLAVDGMW
jgi:hypothetical protein